MRRLAALAFLLFGVPAFAGSYDDFARGIDATNHGNAELALASFSRAIDGRDLAPSYLPSAHLGRARALLRYGRCSEAVTDLSEAIRLRPDYIDAYVLRADANHCLERDDAALRDIDTAIRLKPAAGFFFTRARLNWARGDYETAYGDSERALAGDPANGYIVLWAAMTALRTSHFDANRFERLAAQSGSGWPRPIIELYAGRLAPQDVWRAAGSWAAQRCEADFYIGQWYSVRGQWVDARGLFERAAAQCPRDFIAFDAARHELARTS